MNEFNVSVLIRYVRPAMSQWLKQGRIDEPSVFYGTEMQGTLNDRIRWVLLWKKRLMLTSSDVPCVIFCRTIFENSTHRFLFLR